VIDLGVTETDTFLAPDRSSGQPPDQAPGQASAQDPGQASGQDPGQASAQASDRAGATNELAPLPKRVAEDGAGAEAVVADPVAFTADLLARARQLLITLDRDVSGLEAEQDDERKRIQLDWERQQEAVDLATNRLARMQSHARQLAANKARLAEYETAANPIVPPQLTEEVTADGFLALMDRIDAELRAAHGITGAIRLPRIAELLNQAGVALKRLAQRADETREQLLAGTETELNAEQKEALASFEIGTGILERDLALLDRSLPVTARPWTSPSWSTWEPPERPSAWVRLGALTSPHLPSAPIPYVLPTTCGPGLVIEGSAHRDLALDGVRSLVLRLIAALPPGMAQFSFVDPTGLGESIAPFLALGDYDQALVGRGALVLDHEIEAHLEAVTRQIERVISQCLQGRHATLDDFHATVGGIVEPYRFVVVLDHPSGLTERSAVLLRSIAGNGPRCGVTTIVVRTGKKSGFTRAGQGLPDLPTIKSTPDGLVVDADSGKWKLVPDVPPLLAIGDPPGDGAEPGHRPDPHEARDHRHDDLAVRSADDAGGGRDEAAALRDATDDPDATDDGDGSNDTCDTNAIYERVIVSTGVHAREVRRTPVTPASVFTLLGDARRRRLRDDLPRTSAPVDPEERSTWWTGDATDGLGVPVGRTDGRQVASLWFDQAQGGLAVTGPSGSGVGTFLRTIVDGLAVIYPPQEWQALLVGVGSRQPFTGYGVTRLPHARLVTSEADRELALSVLEATVAIVDRRRERLLRAGTARLGLSGHRQQTGERVPRLVLAVDGVADLLWPGGQRPGDGDATDGLGPGGADPSGRGRGDGGQAQPVDALGAQASELLARLADDGPAHGVHLLLADRVANREQQAALRARLPHGLGTTVHLGVPSDPDLPWTAGDAAFVDRGGEVTTPFRVAFSLPHERSVTADELLEQAAERGFTATPQVYRGDQGAELPPAGLTSLAGDDARQGERRTPRLLVGEPVGLGTPVEVLLRRQEGANLLVVGESAALGQGALFSSLASAVVGHGRHLEAWALDFMPLAPLVDAGADDGSEAGFAAATRALGSPAQLRVGRRRSLAKYLDQVHRLVQDRLVDGEHDGPPRLLVISGLGRARDFDPRANATGIDGLDPVEVLAAILRDGPEVGVHSLVWCESVDALHRRLGPDGLREFGIRIGAAMEEEPSVTLLDTPDAVRLKPHQALLYDESRGRLVKFRPYELPPQGWTLLPHSNR
jgi:hypothetical protein